jgi:hypothetical protein
MSFAVIPGIYTSVQGSNSNRQEMFLYPKREEEASKVSRVQMKHLKKQKKCPEEASR